MHLTAKVVDDLVHYHDRELRAALAYLREHPWASVNVGGMTIRSVWEHPFEEAGRG